MSFKYFKYIFLLIFDEYFPNLGESTILPLYTASTFSVTISLKSADFTGEKHNDKVTWAVGVEYRMQLTDGR